MFFSLSDVPGHPAGECYPPAADSVMAGVFAGSSKIVFRIFRQIGWMRCFPLHWRERSGRSR
jgi:hypothetical protein